MNLKDIYDQLSYGELRHVFVGSGPIVENDSNFERTQYDKLLPPTLLGLTELHKRFQLRKDTINVTLQPNTAVYVLNTDFAQTNNKSSQPVKYIADTAAAPFQGNLLRVQTVWGTLDKKPYEIPLNRTGVDDAIQTSSYNTLVVPTDSEKAPWLKETTVLKVEFRADHPKIDVHRAKAAPSITVIELPPTHLEPLLYYIAARLLNPNGMRDEFHEGNNYTAKFEAACRLLKDQGMEIATEQAADRFEERGFC